MASYLFAGADDLLDGVVVEVVPVGHLDLGAERGVDGLDGDLRERSVDIQNSCHRDGTGGQKPAAAWRFSNCTPKGVIDIQANIIFRDSEVNRAMK